jgi:HD-GYP domain-containing protein (c-di-GMP phosphodiesterase class II)
VTTKFRVRAFLSCFVPFTLLFICSFWMVQWTVRSIVRDGLRTSLRASQRMIAVSNAKTDIQNSRFLKIAGDNSSLKAGMELFLANGASDSARRTVEDQLRELGEHMGFDLLVVSTPDGVPLAGVIRQFEETPPAPGELVTLDLSRIHWQQSRLLRMNGRILQTASVAIDENQDSIGTLTVGELLRVSELSFPSVLVQSGHAIDTNISKVTAADIDRAIAQCPPGAECDLRLKGQTWIALPVQSYGSGFQLLSLQNVDEATAPILSRLDETFLLLTPVCILVALISSFASSRSIERPISAIVSLLRESAHSGKLLELQGYASSIREIRELSEFYNRAAASVRASGENLQKAYFEFVRSLANALDARDPYTAGHSRRVSQLSCAIAKAMGETSENIERIRTGALLHDIGKIGIADAVLQKPGRLTEEEFALIKQHPVIGRRILEDVQGFAPHLSAVELHHENWDGSGYPRGQSRTETPLDARIIHVADAYDAMTSNRSYRLGMSHEKAISILVEYAGTQFDPHIVDVFVNLPDKEILFEEAALGTNIRRSQSMQSRLQKSS